MVEPERNRLEVLTVDAIVEGVHFDRRFTPPDAIGHRALAVNLSDLAAMGATPRLALLSLALPATASVRPTSTHRRRPGGAGRPARVRRRRWQPDPIAGTAGARRHRIGSAKRAAVLTRAGARPGDDIYVSGAIGAARPACRCFENG